MNIRSKNKYERLGRVNDLYEMERESFSDVPAAGNVFTEVGTIYKEIGLNMQILSEGTKGKVISKDVSKTEIMQMGLVFSGAIYGYAVGIGDNELSTFSDISSRTFSRMRESEVPLFVGKILDKAESIGDGLIPFGITAEKKTAGRNKLEDYLGKFSSVNLGKGAKKTANETVNMLLEKGDQKIKVLSKLLLGYKESKPELYSKFESACVIIDKGGGHGTDDTPPAVPENSPA